MASSEYKDFAITPLNGITDLRSPPGTLGIQNFRILLNMSLSEEKKLCRMGGFKKLFSDSPFGFFNQDLHDGLLTCLTFYDAYSYRYIGGGGFTGEFQYPYFFPQVVGPLTLNFAGYAGPYCGYPEDFYSDYHHDGLVHTDVPTMAYARTGYPYSIDFYDAICPQEGSEFYGGSLFYLVSWYTSQTTTPGYPYGDPVPIASSPYDYTMTYCGPTEHVRDACREPITHLVEAQLEDTGRKLIACTKSRIYALSESSANWIILADGLGGQYSYDADCATCSSRRFSSVRLGGYQIFTNDYDPVLTWRFDSPVTGCAEWRAQYHVELLAIGITKVSVLGSWKGVVFYCNLEENGRQFTSKLIWSDFNAPLSVIPSDTSVAGSTELGFGETILRFEPLGGQARLYTDRAIYEVLLVGGDEMFRFLEIYRGPDALRYRYSLVNVGNAHIYLGDTGIFTLEEYGRKPVRVEWQHKASGVIFNGVSTTDLIGFPYLAPFGPINKAQCDQAIGWYDTERKHVWFSWPTDENVCPNMSLLISLQYGFSSLCDKGFTAGLSYTSDPRASLMDWLRLNQVCNFSEFIEDIKKMGIPYDSADDVFDDPPLYFWNETENWDLPQGPDGLCARLGATSIEDLCGEDCKTRTLMVVADAVDFTLKEYDPDVAYRERFVDPGVTYECPYSTTGQYVMDGYTSLVQGDMHKFGKNEDKTINLASIDYVAREQAEASLLYFQVGYGAQPGCPTWKDATPVELRCITAKSAAQHEADNTRPDTFAKFPVFRSGQFIGYRFYILGTGGLSCFSETKLSVRLKQSCW
jgi:hypothetical protein